MTDQLTIEDITNLSIGEMYNKIKLSPEVLKEISHIGDKQFDDMVQDKYKLEDIEEKEDKEKVKWLEIYLGIIDVLKKYCDLREDYYPLLSLWIIGTYFHNDFETYPYLFINAMKGSGKTRLLKLIKILAKDGQMLNSLTEAVLFRTKGTLCIDEFEGITRSGGENLRELLNSAYKKGTTVKRMKKMKTPEGEEQVIDEFNVYRPIVIANIHGMENVLGDRCIPLILEKSDKIEITRLIELFSSDCNVTRILNLIRENDVCDVTLPLGIYTQWNDYVGGTNVIMSHTYNVTKRHLKKIYDTNIDGRHLELSLPLFVLASYLGEIILDNIIKIIKDIVKIKKEDEFTENNDISLIDFVSQLTNKDFTTAKQLAVSFREFLQSNEEWINSKWIGRALKRLNLIFEKKRTGQYRYIKLDIIKAQEKIKIFK